MEIWLVDLDRAGGALEASEAARPRLSDLDVLRLSAIRDPARRQQRRAAAIALRLVLAHVAGDGRLDRVAFTYSRAGKPALPNGELAFSLAHTSQRALIVIAPSGPVGIDLEGQRPLSISPPRRLALIGAAAALMGADSAGESGADGDVLRAWVRLEAYAKAHGSGIGQVLTDAGVLAPSVALRRAARGGRASSWPHNRDLVVRDLALPGVGESEMFAALAGPVAMLDTGTGPHVRPLPDTPEGLATLVGKTA